MNCLLTFVIFAKLIFTAELKSVYKQVEIYKVYKEKPFPRIWIIMPFKQKSHYLGHVIIKFLDTADARNVSFFETFNMYLTTAPILGYPLQRWNLFWILKYQVQEIPNLVIMGACRGTGNTK